MNNNTKDKTFKTHLEQEQIAGARTLSILAALLYLLFVVADAFSLSISILDVVVVRIAVVAFLLLGLAFSYHKSFIKYYEITLASMYLVAAGGIEMMIFLAESTDHASKVYFAGLMLVIMTVFAWSYFHLMISVIVCALIIGSYTYIGLLKELGISNVFVNVLFLVSASSIGVTFQLIRDRYIRENFLLQQSLKKAFDEKSIEAKDNAYLANHDPLTELPNRRYMTELLEESMQIAKEKDKVLVIMFLDLNGFKQVNDIYGHAAGDEVLVIVAKRLELAIRKGDHLSRLGGDEYLVGLMMEKEDLPEIEGMTRKFVDLISQPMNVEGVRIKVGASIGISAYPIHGNKIEVLMEIADKKMYQVKRGKKQKSYEDPKDKKDQEPVLIFPGNSRRT